MPRFDSQISSRKTPPSAQQFRQYEVPDETEYPQGYPQGYAQDEEVDRLERQMREKQRPSDGAKKRIEMLIGMTRHTHSVSLNGNTFDFQTLKSKELREALIEVAKFDNTVQAPFEIRKQLLARSIYRVSGIDIAQFLGADTLEARLNFIDELDDALLVRLYNEYIKMMNEASDKFSIKTEADVKEVIEDLKK